MILDVGIGGGRGERVEEEQVKPDDSNQMEQIKPDDSNQTISKTFAWTAL